MSHEIYKNSNDYKNFGHPSKNCKEIPPIVNELVERDGKRINANSNSNNNKNNNNNNENGIENLRNLTGDSGNLSLRSSEMCLTNRT